MTSSKLPKATLDAVGDRAGGYCERCRRSLTSPVGYSHHHRIPRGMGGSAEPLLSHPSNIVLVCGSGTTGCHGQAERHRNVAMEYGWLVPRYTNGSLTDPRTQPIWLSWWDSWMIPGPGRWFALVERVDAYEFA